MNSRRANKWTIFVSAGGLPPPVFFHLKILLWAPIGMQKSHHIQFYNMVSTRIYAYSIQHYYIHVLSFQSIIRCCSKLPAGSSTRTNIAHDAANIVTHTVTAAATARWCVTLAAKVSGCLIDRKRNVVTPTRLNDDIDSNAIVIVVIDVHIVHPPAVNATLLNSQNYLLHDCTCTSTYMYACTFYARFQSAAILLGWRTGNIVKLAKSSTTSTCTCTFYARCQSATILLGWRIEDKIVAYELPNSSLA